MPRSLLRGALFDLLVEFHIVLIIVCLPTSVSSAQPGAPLLKGSWYNMISLRRSLYRHSFYQVVLFNHQRISIRDSIKWQNCLHCCYYCRLSYLQVVTHLPPRGPIDKLSMGTIDPRALTRARWLRTSQIAGWILTRLLLVCIRLAPVRANAVATNHPQKLWKTCVLVAHQSAMQAV